MIKKIKQGDKELTYVLMVSKKAKNMRVSVSLDKGIVATMPLGLNQRYLDKFVQKNFSWLKNKLDYFNRIDKTQLIKTGPNDFLRKKKAVYEIVKKKIEGYNKFYNFDFKKICIRNQKTRWGSCSQKKTINFSYKLYYLPEALIDYIVVHELCHIGQMNHSRKFWDLVEKLIPDYKLRRKQLHEMTKKFI